MLIRARRDDGNILITVVIVTMLLGMLASVTLRSAEESDRSSSSDRNREIALGVAEAGVQQAIARIGALASGGYIGSFSLPATSTPQGSYEVEVNRTPDGFLIDAEGTVGGSMLGRSRHVKVTMRPPLIFPSDLKPAFFSSSSLELRNNGVVYVGDVWANDSLVVRQGTSVNGSLISAQSWIQLENGTDVAGDVRSGGHNIGGWAIEHHGDRIGGSVLASVSAPTCEEPATDYDVDGTGDVGGDLTTWGTTTYQGEVEGNDTYHRCTMAPAAIPIPGFTFNPANYDDPTVPDDYHEFTIEQFHQYLNLNGAALKGTFVVLGVAGPSQTNRIELCVHIGANCANGQPVSLGGDVTIITNAPVFTADLDDAAVTDEARFVVVSHYDPPPASVCDVNDDNSECAIHAKNHFQFDGTCKTVSFLYADNGPVAIKNNGEVCGSVVSEGILTKNNLIFQYDDRVDRVLGFGPTTFEIARWEEVPLS